jgi:nucleotide-binding universal stress UspA family protein
MTSTSARNSIVVGVDGSPSALHAALWAADVAARRGHPLRLMCASNVGAYTYGGMAGIAPPQSFFDAIEASGTQVLVEVETAIRRVHPDLLISTGLQTIDGAVPTLIEQSDDALLLVLGSRGTGGFRGALVGSTAVALVAHAHCPVAVIRGTAPGTVPPAEGPIVVGVDGSAVSDTAIATAFDEASWRGAELVAVHSWLEYISDPALDRWFGADWEQAQQTENELLAERLAGWQGKYPDVVVRRVVSQGRPAECLLEQAVGAQLVVVGSRGRGGFTGMLLGSTSQALMYYATCPVLVVRPTSE